jgi:hypothetical protein
VSQGKEVVQRWVEDIPNRGDLEVCATKWQPTTLSTRSLHSGSLLPVKVQRRWPPGTRTLPAGLKDSGRVRCANQKSAGRE